MTIWKGLRSGSGPIEVLSRNFPAEAK